MFYFMNLYAKLYNKFYYFKFSFDIRNRPRINCKIVNFRVWDLYVLYYKILGEQINGLLFLLKLPLFWSTKILMLSEKNNVCL